MDSMRSLSAGVVLAIMIVGCSSTASPPADTERPTYEVDGLVYFVTDCPETASLVRGGEDLGPALPRKGLTDQERVESLLPVIRAAYPEAVEVNMIFRNGEVWAGAFVGAGTPHPEYAVESVADFQYELILTADAACPNHPVSWHGIPLLFNRA
jgi:hypothetical protein